MTTFLSPGQVSLGTLNLKICGPLGVAEEKRDLLEKVWLVTVGAGGNMDRTQMCSWNPFQKSTGRDRS